MTVETKTVKLHCCSNIRLRTGAGVRLASTGGDISESLDGVEPVVEEEVEKKYKSLLRLEKSRHSQDPDWQQLRVLWPGEDSFVPDLFGAFRHHPSLN
jgi:hypothetical protein